MTANQPTPAEGERVAVERTVAKQERHGSCCRDVAIKTRIADTIEPYTELVIETEWGDDRYHERDEILLMRSEARSLAEDLLELAEELPDHPDA